jgi:hypothetical protein
MMRAHGIASSTTATIKPIPARVSKTEPREASAPISKKRKAEQFVEENPTADDEEAFNVKPDPSMEKEVLQVKEEKSGGLSIDEATSLMQYYNGSSYANHSPLDSEQAYEYGGPNSGRFGDSSMVSSSGNWGMGSAAAYDYSTPYGSADMQVLRPSIAPNIARSYHATFQYHTSTEGQGGAETPVIVE